MLAQWTGADDRSSRPNSRVSFGETRYPLVEDSPVLKMSFDIEDVLQKLDIGEKAGLLSGSDMWHTSGVPRLNIPKIRVGSLARIEIFSRRS